MSHVLALTSADKARFVTACSPTTELATPAVTIHVRGKVLMRVLEVASREKDKYEERVYKWEYKDVKG